MSSNRARTGQPGKQNKLLETYMKIVRTGAPEEIEQFSKIERQKLVELLCTNSDLLNFMFDKMFVHRHGGAAGGRDEGTTFGMHQENDQESLDHLSPLAYGLGDIPGSLGASLDAARSHPRVFVGRTSEGQYQSTDTVAIGVPGFMQHPYGPMALNALNADGQTSGPISRSPPNARSPKAGASTVLGQKDGKGMTLMKDLNQLSSLQEYEHLQAKNRTSGRSGLETVNMAAYTQMSSGLHPQDSQIQASAQLPKIHRTNSSKRSVADQRMLQPRATQRPSYQTMRPRLHIKNGKLLCLGRT